MLYNFEFDTMETIEKKLRKAGINEKDISTTRPVASITISATKSLFLMISFQTAFGLSLRI